MSLLVMAVLLLMITIPISAQTTDSELIYKSYRAEYEKNFTEAINMTLALEKKHSRDYFYKLRVAWLYYSTGQYIEAEKFYKKAQSVNSQSLEPLSGLMNCAYAIGLWSQVIEYGGQILQTDPLNSYALSSVAFAYFSQKNYSSAIALYTKILKYYPADLTARGYLGWSYHYAGDDRAARTEFETLLRYSPENTTAITGLDAVK